MAEREFAPGRIFLQPAGIVLEGRPTQVRTVLGSCVAVTMRAPRLGRAAMVHCLLPRAAAAAGSMPEAEALRYVDTAIELMLTAFARIGVVPAEIETKLFGGADRIHRGNPNHGYRVGRRNIEAALEVLRGRGIVPAVLEVGGRNGRVIDFDTATGLVMVRRLPCDAAGESL